MRLTRDINDYTREQLLSIDKFYTNKPFKAVVIVPTNNIHDSGYRCMKYILLDPQTDTIVGVLGGGSDVIHINGFNGFGLNYEQAIKTRKAPVIGWRIDCLRESGCVRLFSDKPCIVKDYIGASDFTIYVVDGGRHNGR